MPLTIIEMMTDLQDISPTVQDYMEREMYLDTFAGQEYTDADILKMQYGIIIEELKDMGIKFTGVEDDLLEDWYTAHHLYYLREVLDAPRLIQIFQNKEVLDVVSAMLDTDERSSELVNDLMEYLEENQYTKGPVTYITSYIANTDALYGYLKAVIDSVLDTDRYLMLPDHVRAKKYIEKIEGLRKQAARAVHKIIDTLYADRNLNMQLIDKMLSDYDMDKLSADDIAIYSIIDSGEEVNPTLYAYQNAMMQKHHERAMHHIEYWIDPKKNKVSPLPLEVCILLTSHHDEPGTKPSVYHQEIKEMIEKGRPVLSMENEQEILKMAQVLYPYTSEEEIDEVL